MINFMRLFIFGLKVHFSTFFVCRFFADISVRKRSEDGKPQKRLHKGLTLFNPDIFFKHKFHLL